MVFRENCKILCVKTRIQIQCIKIHSTDTFVRLVLCAGELKMEVAEVKGKCQLSIHTGEPVYHLKSSTGVMTLG